MTTVLYEEAEVRLNRSENPTEALKMAQVLRTLTLILILTLILTLIAYQVDADRAQGIWAKLLAKNDDDQDGLMELHEWTAFVRSAANLGKLDHIKQQLAQMQAAS